MPMPPPEDSNEGQGQGQGNRRRRRELEQLERALNEHGPTDAETLRGLVGGGYWDAGRFDKTLSWSVQKRLLVRDDDGRYSVAPVAPE